MERGLGKIEKKEGRNRRTISRKSISQDNVVADIVEKWKEVKLNG